MPWRRALLSCLVGFVGLGAGRAAQAETVRLRSGRALQADGVAVRERSLVLTLVRDGGTARIELGFDRLDPGDLLTLLDRHAGAADALARLRTARLALDLGLRDQAVLRFRQAADLDPALAPERDAGLASVRALEAAGALVDLETRLRGGRDPQGALTLACALLGGPQAQTLSPAQTARVRLLADLARRRLERAFAQAAAPAVPLVASVPAAPAAEAVPGSPKGDPAAAPLRALEGLARQARDAAADPALGARAAQRHLESAAFALLRARRLWRALPPAAQAAQASAETELRFLLAATYLDLAQLLRQAQRLEEARAHVRAALILEPGSEAAGALGQRIEDDLRRASLGPFDPYGTGGCGTFFSPWASIHGWPYRRLRGIGTSLDVSGSVAHAGSRGAGWGSFLHRGRPRGRWIVGARR